MTHSHRIEITHMETYIDGSGLVAVISVDGTIFSGQYLGDDEDGDDFRFRLDEVSHWQPYIVPSPPSE